MGFLPETGQATTSASGQAGPNKLPNRPPLPGEKLDQSQQLAMDVMAQVPPAWPNLASSMQAHTLPFNHPPSAAGIHKLKKLCSMVSDPLSDKFVLMLPQIQKDASLADKFLPPLPFVDTVQTPCIMVIAKHHEDGRFMATFLNQVQLYHARSATWCGSTKVCVNQISGYASARTITTKPLALNSSMPWSAATHHRLQLLLCNCCQLPCVL